jgi:hypothetical protein
MKQKNGTFAAMELLGAVRDSDELWRRSGSDSQQTKTRCDRRHLVVTGTTQ